MCGRLALTNRCTRLGSIAPPSLVLACLLLSACATVPKREYGVHSIEISGMRQLEEAALKVCLATQARERSGFMLGVEGEPECGVPPFDAARLPVYLWAWPWTEWPVYDETIWNRDIGRITRWYKARGFYSARVTSVEQSPHEQDRTIDLAASVEENAPVLVESVTLRGVTGLDPATRASIQAALTLHKGARFDEAVYDETKRRIVEALRDRAYALARTEGAVRVDPAARKAMVVFTVAPGRRYRFGKVTVQGEGSLPARPIWGAAEIEEGTPFSVSALDDAKRAVYELGSFASVELIEKPQADGDRVDVDIKVVPGRRFRTAIGAGLQVGTDPTLTPADAPSESLSTWDLHLLGRVEIRNFLGGLRRISIEDRPRALFSHAFPSLREPYPGNLLIVDFRQPAFLEPRTSLSVSGRWDRGRDPYTFVLRSDLLASAGPERTFLNGKLRLAVTVNVNWFLPDALAQQPQASVYYPEYHVTYLQYTAALDLRDAPRQPKRGAYFSLTVQQAGYLPFFPSDWDYVRITPDARGYVPLPYGMVLAGRFRLGLMNIAASRIVVHKDRDLYNVEQRLHDLGPLRQRLRGGGSNSVRGYAPNTLGDVNQINNVIDSGGLRQWEASLELRVPITASLGAVAFADFGDVNSRAEFRFEALQTSLGFGFRYQTIIGPVRVDLGIAPGGLQTVGGVTRERWALSEGRDAEGLPVLVKTPFHESTFLGMAGALHFTIGEAY
jgi:outer membrane protein assembly factor BamA